MPYMARPAMNRLPLDRRIQAINCLVEGNSVRSTERLTGVHRDTILRLLGQVGAGCARLMDERMRGLSCRRIQMDEIWCFVGKKQRHVEPGDDPSRVGDQWTFVALDADTKLVPAYRVGKRDLPNAKAFLNDLAARLDNPSSSRPTPSTPTKRLPRRRSAPMWTTLRWLNSSSPSLSGRAATARPRSSARSAR